MPEILLDTDRKSDCFASVRLRKQKSARYNMYRTELFWPDDSGMNLYIVETMDGVFREKEFLKKHRLFMPCSREAAVR